MIFTIFFIFAMILPSRAALYVTKPSKGSVCHAGRNCTIEYLDDGTHPLLDAIGVSAVGLFTGNQKLVQTIAPIDVSTTFSLSFVPNSKAGPNSDDYYIAFISQDYKLNETAYIGYSPFFRLEGMEGSFASPLPSATSSIPLPSSLRRVYRTSTQAEEPTTVGTPTTYQPTLSSSSSTSTFAASHNNGATYTSPSSLRLGIILLCLYSLV